MPLARSDQVEMGVALGLAGAQSEAFTVGPAMVVIGTAATVIVAEGVDDPAEGGVWNDREFRLMGATPAVVASRLTEREPFADREPNLDRPVHLFVRVDTLCIYVGVVSHTQSAWADGELYRCHLRIDPPLRRELLDVIRPPAAGYTLPNLGWLDQVDTDPGRALELFVTDWYPVDVEARTASIAIPGSVPSALADFYRLAEKRPTILGRQNFINPLARLSADVRGEHLVVATENQGGWHWSTPWELDAAGSDPDVWLTEDDTPVREEEPLSRFLLQFSLYEASMAAPYKAFLNNLPGRVLSELEARLHRVPLRPFLAPIAPTCFLVGPGLVAHVSAEPHDSDAFDVWSGALHRNALRPLSQLDLPWRRFDG